VVAIASFVAGAVAGSGSALEDAASRFAGAWAREDYPAMFEELNDASRARYSAREFTRIYARAEQTATIAGLDPGGPQESGVQGGAEIVRVPLEFDTHAFGDLRGEVGLPFRDGGIAWEPYLVFPGLQPGDRLDRRMIVTRRAPILARDGTALAEGASLARTSPLGTAAQEVAGAVGPADPAGAARQLRTGFPAEAPVGVSGLEKAFNARLAGQPGGQLIAVAATRRRGERDETPEPPVGDVIATGTPRQGQAVKTTIDPDLQQTAVAALAGRAGGVAALDPRDGSVLAAAGAAFSAPQPPGSTFKIVTTTAALEGDVVALDDVFPYVASVNVGGREIANAHDESCGGTFIQAFARSCNSVFAPLGPGIGEQRLVDTAERYGFNSPPALYDDTATEITDPPQSTIPKDIPTDLDLGVSAIGQGKVLATPLELATMSQVIAAGGIRRPTPIVSTPGLGPSAEPVRVTSTRIARTIRRLMEAVVTSGTGTAAALPGVAVAGKTGTAELGPKPDQGPLEPGEKPEQAVDAWFTAFAPAKRPRIAVAVMVVNADGDGGAVAAPIAREVIAAALG
jgi:cell division protein FtsI/penicillin-binding protein 2